jgi:beta-lactamase class A
MKNSIIKQFLTTVIFTLILLAPAAALAGEEGVVRYGVTPQKLQDEFFNGYAKNGYRAERLTGYRSGDSVRYFTRWVQNTDMRLWSGHYGLTGDEFHAIFLLLRAQGFYPHDVSGYSTPGGIRFATIWYKNPGNIVWAEYRNVTRPGMQNLVDTIGKQGWAPHRVEAYESGGESRYISIWYHQPNTGYKMHNKMTRDQYQDHLDDYQAQGYKLTHLDAHTVDGDVYYSGIWKVKNSTPRVRSNRNWRVFQRYYNNYWADGYFIDNFYAAETPDGVRYGGIWYYDGPVEVNDNSPLSLKVRKEVDSAPARGGAAVFNLTTGEEILVHGDQTFAIASTSKIGILYALLKEIDLGNESWTATINSGSQYGNNQCSYLSANTNYTIAQMAQFMIRCSNNWATNRLIQRVGRNTTNQHLDGLGLDVTRIHRYMTGTGAPSAHGNSSAGDDRQEGWENLSTPREMVTLLKKVLQNNVLSNLSELRFWSTMKMDGDNNGINGKNYIAAQVTPMFNPIVTVYNKAGSLTGSPRFVRSDAGRFRFPDGQEVLVAIFMDDISDNPDNLDAASDASTDSAEQAIKNVAKDTANKYYQ